MCLCLLKYLRTCRPNHVWSYDFVVDRTFDGRPLPQIYEKRFPRYFFGRAEIHYFVLLICPMVEHSMSSEHKTHFINIITGGYIMRKAMLLLVLVGWTSSLWGADPIIGAWKLNVAKSKIPQSDTAPKEITDVYREGGTDQIELIRTGTQRDGSPDSSKWVWPRVGGIAERTSPSPLPVGTSYIELLIDSGHWYVTILQNGKQNILMHKVITKDGKTMRITVKSINAQGKPIEQLQVFEKQ
jgi:hypothetical protein